MNAKIKQLRDLVVGLDRVDRNLDAPDPAAYQAAARTALSLTHQEMGLLPIGDFAGPVNSLQNLAENLYFVGNGCFADLDGSGRATSALTSATALLGRLRASAPEAVQEISASLFARLHTASRTRRTTRRGRKIVGSRA